MVRSVQAEAANVAVQTCRVARPRRVVGRSTLGVAFLRQGVTVPRKGMRPRLRNVVLVLHGVGRTRHCVEREMHRVGLEMHRVGREIHRMGAGNAPECGAVHGQCVRAWSTCA